MAEEILRTVHSIIGGLIFLAVLAAVAWGIGNIRAIYFDDREWIVRVRPKAMLNRMRARFIWWAGTVPKR